MLIIYRVVFISLLIVTLSSAQGFYINKSGEQTFHFKDDMGRNQATFFSHAPFEDITGLSNEVNGWVSFDIQDVKNTLTGEVFIKTTSIKTGIENRDEHLRTSEWLNAEAYPNISFVIKEIETINNDISNKFRLTVLGDFTIRGVTKQEYSDVTMEYLEESELTKIRMPGDLLGVKAKFNINLSDYGVRHMLIGKRVSEEVEIKANIIGTNASDLTQTNGSY
jgi:polyisoprenoid-binding protein YceI